MTRARPRRISDIAIFAALVSLVWLSSANAQQASDGLSARKSNASNGSVLFRSLCGFCHGADAGGAQGPNLTTSSYPKVNDQGATLRSFLQVGRPSLGMPAFSTLGATDVEAMWTFIRSKADAPSARPPMDKGAILVGDVAAGRRYFEGRGQCSTCHSITGDLRDVGARFDPVLLQGRILNPRVVGVSREKPDVVARHVSIESATNRVSGVLVQVNDFFVTLIDDAGVRRTIPRDNGKPKVTIDDPAEFHRQALLTWKDRDLWDVTAFLATLR